MADMMQIGRNIRILRENMGLTQRALADGVLVSFQAISAWERGLSVPDLENAVRIAEFFGVSVDALLTRTGQELYVGIDGDSTKTEFVLFEKDGTIKNIVYQEGANPNDRNLEHSVQVLSRGLELLLGNKLPKMVFAGIAGASQENYKKAITARLMDRFHTGVAVDWDAANVLSLGADPENSVAVVCGTGSCVFARKGTQQYHFGGWGQLFDQAGSAYDVGKDALRCTLAAEDGLASHNTLTKLVQKTLGGGAFDNISNIYKNGSPYIASLAKLVLQTAQQGDACALSILHDNAERLALLIRTAVKHLGTQSEIVAAGSFLKHDLFRNMVEEQAGVKLVMPDIPPVYGACVEALRAAGVAVNESFHRNFVDSYRMLAG